jgi:hypothetical protein
MKNREEIEDFYQKTFRVNMALQTALYLLDDLSDNYLYKHRVKQLIERFKSSSQMEIDRITHTLTKEEIDPYAKISHDMYKKFQKIKIGFK